ncbi:cell envelope integrity protein TolA [Pseudoduganella sp. R-34]|uniref:cell envelope integrity protein TolA n=1 Tax=Pseudoduganella sp. R-34 TaxID=3404062 RepID=UPI003CFB79C9
MHQYTHSHAELAAHDGHTCPTCGQPWPQDKVLEYGASKPNRWGIAFTIGLHLLVVLIYFIKPKEKIDITPPSKAGEMVYITPGKPAPQPKPKSQPKAKPSKETPRSSRAYLPPNKNAITEVIKPQEKIVPPEQAKLTPVPDTVPDMAALIEQRRRARQGDSQQPAQEEDPAAAAKQRAMANIMGAQGRNADGSAMNDTGGIFEVTGKSFSEAIIKFRGFSPSRNKKWLRQVRVELGTEKDIETAIITTMIEMIRREKPGDFMWESPRLGRDIPLSGRKEDEPILRAFLMKEFFPDYYKRN